jgi:hypothetical protein
MASHGEQSGGWEWRADPSNGMSELKGDGWNGAFLHWGADRAEGKGGMSACTVMVESQCVVSRTHAGDQREQLSGVSNWQVAPGSIS